MKRSVSVLVTAILLAVGLALVPSSALAEGPIDSALIVILGDNISGLGEPVARKVVTSWLAATGDNLTEELATGHLVIIAPSPVDIDGDGTDDRKVPTQLLNTVDLNIAVEQALKRVASLDLAQVILVSFSHGGKDGGDLAMVQMNGGYAFLREATIVEGLAAAKGEIVWVAEHCHSGSILSGRNATRKLGRLTVYAAALPSESSFEQWLFVGKVADRWSNRNLDEVFVSASLAISEATDIQHPIAETSGQIPATLGENGSLRPVGSNLGLAAQVRQMSSLGEVFTNTIENLSRRVLTFEVGSEILSVPPQVGAIFTVTAVATTVLQGEIGLVITNTNRSPRQCLSSPEYSYDGRRQVYSFTVGIDASCGENLTAVVFVTGDDNRIETSFHPVTKTNEVTVFAYEFPQVQSTLYQDGYEVGYWEASWRMVAEPFILPPVLTAGKWQTATLKPELTESAGAYSRLEALAPDGKMVADQRWGGNKIDAWLAFHPLTAGRYQLKACLDGGTECTIQPVTVAAPSFRILLPLILR